MSKNKIYWILQITGWALFATINIGLNFLQDSFNIRSFFYTLLISFWYVISTHIFRYYMITWEWVNSKIKDIILKLFVCLIGLTLSNFLVHIIILLLLGVFDYSYDLDSVNIGVYLLATVIVYFVWTLFYFIYQPLKEKNPSSITRYLIPPFFWVVAGSLLGYFSQTMYTQNCLIYWS